MINPWHFWRITPKMCFWIHYSRASQIDCIERAPKVAVSNSSLGISISLDRATRDLASTMCTLMPCNVWILEKTSRTYAIWLAYPNTWKDNLLYLLYHLISTMVFLNSSEVSNYYIIQGISLLFLLEPRRLVKLCNINIWELDIPHQLD